MHKTKLLEQIEADIITDNVCPNLAQNAKNLVMGEGNLDAEIVFIGEAPGQKEDELGRPFVGAAGKFLDEMLAGIDMKRSDVYITNIVKYRPPNNRDPEPSEKNEFFSYLLRQISAIKPKLVATLGRHSMNMFLPNQRISEIHGYPKRTRLIFKGAQEVDEEQGDKEKRLNRSNVAVDGSRKSLTQQFTTNISSASGSDRRQSELVLILLPLYHPAAALYNASMRQTLTQDFSKIPLILKKLTN